MNVMKIGSEGDEDVFIYRDEYNEERIIRFPCFWRMSEAEVENWLNL
jgi:hypothetical protein